MIQHNKKNMVTAVFRDRTQANRVYTWLREHGYMSDEINVLMSDQTHHAYADEDEEPLSSGSHAAEGIATGGAIGTAVGATLAAIAAIGTSVFVPGLGLVVAGPILAAFAGAGVGAVAGGVLGGLIGLGIPESNARAYEEALREGGIVIGVHPHTGGDVDRIRGEFERHQGENVVVI